MSGPVGLALVLGTVLGQLPPQPAEPVSLQQEPNTWVKRSPLPGGPVSPAMGYEASLAYDPRARLVIRWGGHNQSGGQEQNAETWTFDPATARWALKEPNGAPPGVCCAQQNVFDLDRGRFLRFPAFSGSHGWQWFREIYLSNSSVWSYDLAANTWRDQRPLPAPAVGPLRCASWDSDHQVAVVFGGEGIQEGTVVYDPYTNTWTRMRPAVQPAFRSGGNMDYDAARQRHVLFGSQFTDDPHTWAYDLRRNVWQDMKPATQPPTDRNDCVLAYDSVNRVIVALVRVLDRQAGNEPTAGHLETWAYDTGRNAWTPLKPAREPDGWGNRHRIMIYVPDQNVCLLEDYVHPTERVPGVEREQQIWTYRYAEAKPDESPRPPPEVRVTTETRAALVQWQASPTPRLKGYVVYRGKGEQPWRVDFQPVGRVDGATTQFRDAGVEPGTCAYYCVRALGQDDQESADSAKVRTQPRVVEDVVVSVVSPREVRLVWPVPGNDVTGYHVERAVVEVWSEDEILRLKQDTPPLPVPSVGAVKAIGPFTRLTREPLSAARYTDAALDLTKPQAVEGEPLYRHRFRANQLDPKGRPYPFAVYAYRVRAVNALGVESGPSSYVLTIPRAPQWLFSKEEGTHCHWKWAANPEQGLRGYRVYRMGSPRINGPGQATLRLTGEPITTNQYTDAEGGKEPARYWVVAVDALGQEGIPSAPTWHLRLWRKYYVPFVGEWHQ